ncbi:uncharacterized protein E0L32_008598 [Thyridium curvatum]|uniref:Flavin reductase like domain-containing protein n=1 Tax=Thyridium curvatum TaxID=1093900 RepID=A0A507AZD9_9PEZI|nr:uncharacterized protein E0L32_008598 [Thyridium curvatum]TPX10379.1 hypothetical protein E0L32_008598 [Thyridium curvatum]
MSGDSTTHSIISPAILYWGTPVVLISSENEDGTTNIAPMSSAWWLTNSCMLGLGSESKTTENLLRTGQCVLNLPNDAMVGFVNKLADTTGLKTFSEARRKRNYTYVADKWARAGLHRQTSELVRPCRIQECLVQMECEVVHSHPLRKDEPDRAGLIMAIEVRVLRVHVRDELRMDGYPNRVDPDKWRPLIMMFQEFYGLGSEKVAESVLGRISEEKYRFMMASGARKLPGDDGDHITGK